VLASPLVAAQSSHDCRGPDVTKSHPANESRPPPFRPGSYLRSKVNVKALNLRVPERSRFFHRCAAIRAVIQVLAERRHERPLDNRVRVSV